MNLIDVDELLNSINKEKYQMPELKCAYIIDCILKAPTVEVNPVNYAHWIKAGRLEGKTVLKCSHCFQGTTEKFAPVYKYCPNCGAKMDEVTKNE